MPQPSVFNGLQACHLPTFKRSIPSKPSHKPFPAICFQGIQLPLARFKRSKPSKPSCKPFPQAFPRQLATTLVNSCPSHLFLKAFNPAGCPPPNPASRPFQGNWQQLSQLHAPAICFYRRSSLPFARLQTPQAFPRHLAKATGNNSRSYPSHLFFRTIKPAACPPSNPPNRPNPPAGLSKATSTNSRSYMPQPSVFKGVQSLLFARLHTLQTLPQAFPRQLATTLTATCPSHLFLKAFKACCLPAFKRSKLSKPSCKPFQGN